MKLLKTMGRFGLVGILATLVHVLVAGGLIAQTDWSATAINAVAFVVANAVTYVGNALWGFQSSINWGTFGRHVVSSAMTLAFGSSTAYLLEHLGFSAWQVTLSVVLVVPAFSFVVHRFYTYRHA